MRRLANGNIHDTSWAKALAVAYGLLYVILSACVPASRRLPAGLHEVSGAAFRQDGSLVLVNDSGNDPLLFAVDLLGNSVAYSSGPYAANIDWEALAYDAAANRLAICDVGDNRRARKSIEVTVVDEGGRVTAHSSFAYPDFPHDCEACLLRGDTVSLLTKARTLGGDKSRSAYVYSGDVQSGGRLTLVDSFSLRRRSVTDAVYLSTDTLAVLAYDFRLLGPLPFSRTSVYIGTLEQLRGGRARRIRVRAPLTLTQFEAIAHPRDGSRRLLIASERTPLSPQRYRWIGY